MLPITTGPNPFYDASWMLLLVSGMVLVAFFVAVGGWMEIRKRNRSHA